MVQLPRPHGLPDARWHREQEALSRARLNEGRRTPARTIQSYTLAEQISAEQDRAQAVQSDPLTAGWNTLVTAEVTWPEWATRALVMVNCDLTLVEGVGTAEVYGGALKITTNGTDSHEQLCFGAFDPRGTDDVTVATVSDSLALDTRAEHVTAHVQFYPWHPSWYPGDPGSHVACHLLVVFIR